MNGVTVNSDGSLTVTGLIAKMVCGGPDDLHYQDQPGTVTGHVVASAKVSGLSTSLQAEPITHTNFPSYLKTDKNSRVFSYVGPLTAITVLAEQYHP